MDSNKISSILSDLEPKNVFYFFEEICKIPHGSGNTKEISDYLKNFAICHSLDYYQDDFNNVIIYKQGPGDLNKEPIILQGHMDMVCEKSPESTKNMELEGLDLEIDGDFISAKGTSLGADNGIAIAMILAILEDDSLDIPSIEAVFTSDEEIGLIGAEGLDCSKLKGKSLINLDSEEEGYLVVSCAGGNRLDVCIPLEYDDMDINKLTNEGYNLITISISGLKGGHSGIEIGKGLANANKLIGELLAIFDDKLDIKLIDINGGTLDNAIPNEANCTILANVDEVNKLVKDFEIKINNDFKDIEDDISLEVLATDFSKINISSNNVFSDKSKTINNVFSDKSKTINKVLSDKSKNNVIGFINNVPNGVCKISDEIDGLVETSLNLGIIGLGSDLEFNATISLRSAFDSERDNLNDELKSIAEEYDGFVEVRGAYPSWEYNKESKLRDLICKIYEEKYGKPMIVEIIHAGLECGLFVNKIDGLDAVSMGPTLKDVHSYNEKMSISSVYRTYNLLLKILKELKYN